MLGLRGAARAGEEIRALCLSVELNDLAGVTVLGGEDQGSQCPGTRVLIV